MKKISLGIALLVILIVGIALLLAYDVGRQTEEEPTLPVDETPTATSTPEAFIKVTEPISGATIKSPLTIEGEARGTWYFEASFPVKLLDANGNMLAQAPAQAQGEWMTTDFVPFSVTLTFTKATTSTGVLVLEKDNPSGLPENAMEYRIPVKFAN